MGSLCVAVPGATCWGLGDPHYQSFDGRRFDFYGKGEYWLVKSRRLAIQSRLEQLPSNAAISFHSGVAFAGEALQGTTVEVLGAAGGLRAQLGLTSRPFLHSMFEVDSVKLLRVSPKTALRPDQDQRQHVFR